MRTVFIIDDLRKAQVKLEGFKKKTEEIKRRRVLMVGGVEMGVMPVISLLTLALDMCHLLLSLSSIRTRN